MGLVALPAFAFVGTLGGDVVACLARVAAGAREEAVRLVAGAALSVGCAAGAGDLGSFVRVAGTAASAGASCGVGGVATLTAPSVGAFAREQVGSLLTVAGGAAFGEGLVFVRVVACDTIEILVGAGKQFVVLLMMPDETVGDGDGIDFAVINIF